MKKLVSTLLIISMAISNTTFTKKVEVMAEETFKITCPAENSLVGAGYFDIEWEDTATGVSSYSVYIDDVEVGTTTETEYEYYSTEVKMHTVSVVAKDSSGSTRETAEVSFGISKKGLCVNDVMGRYLEPVDMNASWYYNWSPSPFSYRAYKDIEFVPMIWGVGNDGSIPTVAANGYKKLLAYNEPDMTGDAGGSNTDVSTVVAHWPNFQGYDFYLGAPAPALSPSWDNGTWFRTFMDSIDHDTVDFIPLHCYYGQWAGIDAAYTFLYEVVDKTYEMYGKPIWVTEFAISGWGYGDTTNIEAVKTFMQIVLQGLDERSYVERYSWFSFNTTDGYNGISALWSQETGELTELGELYVECGVPAGYKPTPEEELNYKVTETTRTTLLPDSVVIDDVTYEDYINQTGVTAVATSEIDGNNIAMKAIDNSVTTRWESVHGVDPQSITVDLGEVRSLKQIDIIWEAASAKNYTVEVSEDGVNYTEAAIVEYGSNSQNRYDSIVLKEMVKGRYVKINGSSRSTVYGYSIYDMAFYGTEPIVETEPVEIIGFQYNTTNNGFRVVTGIEPVVDGKKVVECGNIYGIMMNGTTSDSMNLNSLGDHVKKFESTDLGLSSTQYSESDTANNYVMTMINNGMTKEALSQKYMVRAYAKLEDGTVLYSNVEEFSIYSIADALYQGKLMSSSDKHNYLYENILYVVNNKYETVAYDSYNSIIKAE